MTCYVIRFLQGDVNEKYAGRITRLKGLSCMAPFVVLSFHANADQTDTKLMLF